jgi:Crinkler effector protein N-terminal domain
LVFDDVFSIQIAETASISDLKVAIKEKKPILNHIPADVLTLSCPGGRILKDEPEIFQHRHVGSLTPVKTGLSKFFPVEPQDEYLHIIVRCPPTCACE